MWAEQLGQMSKVSLKSLILSTFTVWHSHHHSPYTIIPAPALNTFIPEKQPVVLCNKPKQILCIFDNILASSDNISLNLDYNKQPWKKQHTNFHKFSLVLYNLMFSED